MASQVFTVLRGEGDADAGVGPDMQPIEHDGLLEGSGEGQCSLHGLSDTDVGQNHGEFVAAQSRQDVFLA